MKFLIWQTAYLGDVVLATPLIETLKLNFPDSEIAFVGRPFIREMLRGSPAELIPYDRTLKSSLEIIRYIRSYDVALSPHISMRSALLLALSRIRVRIGFDRSELPFLYTHRVKHRWELHEVDRNLQLLGPLGVKKTTRTPKLYISEQEKESYLRKFHLRESEYVVFSPSSNFPLKMWSKENWKKLATLLSEDIKVVITGTQRDRDTAEFISSASSNVLSLAGMTSLRELMGVIAGAKLVVSNDSSPVHIANALGVPAITVYTSTSPDYGFYPLTGGYLKNPLECSPCSPNPKRCIRGSPECLHSISADEVLSLVHKLLGV